MYRYATSFEAISRLFKTSVPVLFALAMNGIATTAVVAQGAMTNGWMHTGTISPAGETDSWTFTAATGSRITVRVGEISQVNNFTPRIRLLNPQGTQQATDVGASAAEVSVIATNTGTFTVQIDGVAANATGQYRLTLGNIPAAVAVSPGDEGGPLTNGIMHTGVIDVGDLDVWTFSAATGETINVEIGEVSTTGTFTPALWFYGPDGRLLDSAYGASAARTIFRATNSGTFTVVVGDYTSAYSGSGDYRLTLAKTGSAVVISPDDEGGPLTNGVVHTGVIDVGDIDVWTFDASAGEALTVGMGETQSVGSFTPVLWLYGPDGRLLDSSYGAAAAQVSFRATNSGTFTVVAGDYSSGYSGSGDYRLTLAKTGSAVVISPGDEGGPLTNGVVHTGVIDVGDIDVWSFSAATGETINIEVGEVSTAGIFTPALWFYGPDGRLLDSAYGASAARTIFRATNNGTFTVVVGDYSSAFSGSGNYRLTLAKTGDAIVVSPGDEGGPMVNGIMHTGTITVGDLDVWNFSANSGESMMIEIGELVAGSPLTPALWLYGPDGRLLDSSYGAAAAQVIFRATNSGTFTIVAGDYSSGYSGSGDYRLTLAKTGVPIVVSPGDESGPLTNGVVHTGVIDVGDIDVWNFSATTGETINIEVGEVSTTGIFTPALWFYGPDGRLLDSAYGASAARTSFRATNSGTFTVVVGDYSSAFSGSGNYRLTLAKTGDPIVVSPGDEGGPMVNGIMHTGTITVGDLDVWNFTATAGESLVVSMGEIITTSVFTPVLWFYGPDGRLLDSHYAAAAAQVTFRATNSGTFTVVVGDYSSGYSGTGEYRLTLAKTGSAVEVSPGDEGGRLNGADQYEGMLDVGDLDVWSFTLCAGETISLVLEETVPSNSFTPWLRLYGRDGTLQRSSYGASIVEFSNVRATNSGTFLVVVGDYSGGYGGSGAYRLTVNGLSHDLRLCVPRVSGTNVTLSGVGGEIGTDFTVLTSPLVEAPLATWTPLFTNQFDFFGTFSRTNPFVRAEPRRFYILRKE